jgi:hypothetical protein
LVGFQSIDIILPLLLLLACKNSFRYAKNHPIPPTKLNSIYYTRRFQRKIKFSIKIKKIFFLMLHVLSDIKKWKYKVKVINYI